MPLRAELTIRADGVYLLTLDGRLDNQTYKDCEKKIGPILTPLPKNVIIDMGGLVYITSVGLRVIMNLKKTVDANKGRLSMINVQPQILKVLEIVNAMPTESVFSNLEEADRYYDMMQKKVLSEKK